ncbi:Prenylcysteine oxidase [Sporormia fimetaria CBS 119925]|uniref:Prenylcysteine oxidase n=1 Tax=Sporormia fimetaria CBS 119925 TaxID=1340428 RepID=A0A6A6V102_9PLEO|nr:Prenylcysteine oxidase [Sporormia fimetaria CBS 119925]
MALDQKRKRQDACRWSSIITHHELDLTPLMHLLAVTIAALACCAAALNSDGVAFPPRSEIPEKRVAIIGAGAAGSSAAFHLASYANASGVPVNVTVFERNPYIGGRTTTVNAWNDPSMPVELGGSIFVSVNHILVNASRQFNLTSKSHQQRATDDDLELGVWDGKAFVLLMKTENSWWDYAKLFWKYGWAPLKANRLMKETVAKFLRLYDEPVFPWKSLNDAAEGVGLLEVTGVTGQQFLMTNKVGDKFAKEVVQASTRVNYASNLGLIHGLETMVCLATNGAMAVDGGNWQIFANMLKSSNSTVRLSTSVASIRKQPDNTYFLETQGETVVFDNIILAAPFQFSGLVIDPPLEHVPDQIPYVGLHVTLFASPHRLDPRAFNMALGKVVPQVVLTVLPEGEDHGSDPDGQGSPGFFSISIVDTGYNPHTGRSEHIYKIFSAQKVGPAFLGRILGIEDLETLVGNATAEQGIPVTPGGPITWIHQHFWHSYPYEYPRVTFEELQLDEGLWYTSGIESFISTMETSALMGKNVARLVVDQWVKIEKKGAKKADLEDCSHESKWLASEQRLGIHKEGGGEQRPLMAAM